MSNENFYPLTHEEWLDWCKRLHPSELKVLLYIHTLDPYGSKWLDLNLSMVGEKLNLNKGTVSRAVRKLADQGLIDLEISHARIKLSCPLQENSWLNQKNNRTKLSPDNTLSGDNQDDLQTTRMISTQRSRPPHNDRPLKRTEGQRSTVSRSIRSIRSLSEGGQEETALNKDGKLDDRTVVQNNSKEQPFYTPKGELDPSYQKWLEAKALSLPNPPSFLQRWVEVCAPKFSYQREYLQVIQQTTPADVTIPDRELLEQSCVSAMLRGDRQWVKDRLQGLIDGGHTELVHDLVMIYRDWKMKVTPDGLQDRVKS